MNGKLINANFTKEHYEMLKYIFEDKIEKQMAIKILKIFRGHNIKKKKQQQQQQQ